MLFHGDPCARRIMRLDRRQNALMLRDHLRHPPRLRQSKLAKAVDMNLDLLDQRPDAWVSRNIGDRRMKQLVGLVEGVAIAGRVRLALPLQDRMQAEDLARGGEP